MDHQRIARELAGLAAWNRDAARAYDTARAGYEGARPRDAVSDVCAKLAEIGQDHERRAGELDHMAERLGDVAQPSGGEDAVGSPAFSPVAEQATSDPRGLLKALGEGEKALYRRYDQLHQDHLPEDVEMLLSAHILRELYGLHYVLDALSSSAWDTGVVRRP